MDRDGPSPALRCCSLGTSHQWGAIARHSAIGIGGPPARLSEALEVSSRTRSITAGRRDESISVTRNDDSGGAELAFCIAGWAASGSRNRITPADKSWDIVRYFWKMGRNRLGI